MTAIDDRTRATALFVSDVLFRATAVGFGLLLVSSLFAIAMLDTIYGIHNSLFEVSRSDYNGLIFSFLANMKVLVLVFLLSPACAIRWALRGGK